MSDELLISAERIQRYYGKHCALDDVNFQARRGEVIGFLGPNGAGKSTLMQILCGTLAASSGNVTIAGYDIRESPLNARANLGYLPEHPPLYQDVTVDDYLNFCASLKGINNEARTERLTQSKKKCHLLEAGQRLISGLSKGYQQRIGLAQAIIHDPQVLILDEPSSGLDPEQIIEMRELIKNYSKERCVIFSTHILAEAQGVCDRILILNKGRLILDKSLKDMHQSEMDQNLIVSFSSPPISVDSINTIDGVGNVVQIASGRYRIFGHDCDSLAGRLAETATANHWGITELHIESQTLEQVYMQLTRDSSSERMEL
jgi:ABC-2 type transport system ATP-binding protein